MSKKKAQRVTSRGRSSTTLSLAPLSVDEALGALLKTPPPTKEPKATKKRKAARK